MSFINNFIGGPYPIYHDDVLELIVAVTRTPEFAHPRPSLRSLDCIGSPEMLLQFIGKSCSLNTNENIAYVNLLLNNYRIGHDKERREVGSTHVP